MNQNSPMSMAMPAAVTMPLINNASQTQFGFAAESLPFVETISPQMRKQIIEGKDVNLAALLIPYYSGPMNNDDKLNSEGCQANCKLDPRINRNLNLNEFMQAFAIYKNVMCEAYPSRRKELDLYERDIVDMGTSYGGKGFYEYHKQFSSKAAAYLRYYNTKVDWSLRNNRLFCNIFASHKPITCNMCHSTDHTAGFCPELLLDKNQRSHKDNSHNAFSQNQTIDIYGRPKRFFQGKEICNNFNGERGCVRPVCNRAHVCFTCNEEHSQLSCSQDRARSNGSKKLPEPPQPASKKLNIPSVSTPVDVSKLLSYLEQHPDQNFVTYLGQGLSQGFYTGINPIPTQTLECKNLLSARSQIEITTKLIESEMQKGFLVGPFNKMPFDIYRVNPVGIAEGKYSKKKRLIVDLSAPHNDQDHTCLNELINKEDFSLNYVTIYHAIDIIKKTGKGSWLCKTDISDAFKLIPIHPSLRPFHGIK